MDGEGFAEDVAGLGEDGVDGAVFQGQFGGEVGGDVAVRGVRVGVQGGHTVGDGGERVVVHQHQGGGVFGDVAVFGQHHGDGLADIGHVGLGEDRAVEVEAVGGARERDDQAGVGEMGTEVGQGPNGVDAG